MSSASSELAGLRFSNAACLFVYGEGKKTALEDAKPSTALHELGVSIVSIVLFCFFL